MLEFNPGDKNYTPLRLPLGVIGVGFAASPPCLLFGASRTNVRHCSDSSRGSARQLMVRAFEAHCQETTSAGAIGGVSGLARSGQPPSLIGRFNLIRLNMVAAAGTHFGLELAPLQAPLAT